MKQFISLIIFCISFSNCIFAQGNQNIKNYRQSKKHLYKIWGYSGQTFYCNCKYERRNIKECGLQNKNPRSKKMEWEHIVPMSRFTQDKSRRYMRSNDARFNKIEADMYNIVPSVGYLNMKRSNYAYNVIDGEKRNFGSCDFEIQDRIIEPSPDIRGDIARAVLYMAWEYPDLYRPPIQYLDMMYKWLGSDPVTKPECERYKKIKQIQGDENIYLKVACEKFN